MYKGLLLIFSYLAFNMILIFFVRFIRDSREQIVLTLQVLYVISSNIALYLYYFNKWEFLDLLSFSIMTFWTSIFILEIWAMTNDGYTVALLILIQRGIINKVNIDVIGNIMQNKKEIDRYKSLEKLKLIKQDVSGVSVTPLGSILLTSLNFLKFIFFLEERKQND